MRKRREVAARQSRKQKSEEKKLATEATEKDEIRHRAEKRNFGFQKRRRAQSRREMA